MRIIAGEWRGLTIQAPKGEATRPTIDRVRESLMSSLGSLFGGFEGLTVMDAFAGSGALGLEALSRGAACAWFYEIDRDAQAALAGNIEHARGAHERAVVRKVDVLSHPPVAGHAPFDLVLLDPPYATDPARVFAMLDALEAAGALSPEVVIAYEHAKTDALAEYARQSAAQWSSIATKKYGKVCIDLFGRATE